MECSLQNRFLGHLHKLGIDVRQFSDKTFDGLFDDSSVTDFFNWFLENITTDNVLSESEQAEYAELEKNNLVITEDELNSILSSCEPSFEELQNLDTNYIENTLPNELEELRRVHSELSEIKDSLEYEKSIVKKEQISEKESISNWKKKITCAQQNCQDINLLFETKLDDVKSFLLKESTVPINFSSLNKSLSLEEKLFSKLNSHKLLEEFIFSTKTVPLLSELEEDLTCVKTFLIFSKGTLVAEKTKLEELSKLQEKLSRENNPNRELISLQLLNSDNVISETFQKIKTLESEIKEKNKELAKYEVQKILNDFIKMGIELNQTCLQKLTTYRDFMKLTCSAYSSLLEILTKVFDNLNETLLLKKDLNVKLIKCQEDFSKDLDNLELKKQRFEIAVRTSQHPLSVALKNFYNGEDNFENQMETLQNLVDLLAYASDDSNFVDHKFKIKMQSSIKSLLKNSVYGPTSQIMLMPIDLLRKFQNCQQRGESLSNNIKRLASKYFNAEGTLSKTDRKLLILWMDFLTNPEALSMLYKQ